MLRHLHILGVLLITWGHSAYGVDITLPGLNIEEILTPSPVAPETEMPAGATHLDVMLQNQPFPASVVDKQVVITLAAQPSGLSDTDESIQEENLDVTATHLLKFASKFSVPQVAPLLTPTEIDYNQAPTKITESLCRKLAKDAFSIANAHHNARTREATTCLCVVLRDEEKHPKKFVFHNSTGEMQASMRKKADDLAYGIRNAHLAHAEAQFIEFLIQRAKQRIRGEGHFGKAQKPKYTHILGMGCSRKHCQECNALCKLFLGHDYCRFTAAMEQLNNAPSMPVVEECAQEDEADLQMVIPEKVQKFKAIFQENAMRDGSNRSANYRLLATMQAAIKDKTGRATTLDFTNARFNPTNRTKTQQLTEAKLPPTETEDSVGGYKEEATEDRKTGKKRKAAS